MPVACAILALGVRHALCWFEVATDRSMAAAVFLLRLVLCVVLQVEDGLVVAELKSW